MQQLHSTTTTTTTTDQDQHSMMQQSLPTCVRVGKVFVCSHGGDHWLQLALVAIFLQPLVQTLLALVVVSPVATCAGGLILYIYTYIYKCDVTTQHDYLPRFTAWQSLDHSLLHAVCCVQIFTTQYTLNSWTHVKGTRKQDSSYPYPCTGIPIHQVSTIPTITLV